MKAQASWQANQAVSECRRACGGLGYSYYSKFAYLTTMTDINSTWEGDNNVLLQQTAKYLLDMYKAKMKGTSKKQTATCEWITTDDVTQLKLECSTIEQMLQP